MLGNYITRNDFEVDWLNRFGFQIFLGKSFRGNSVRDC